MNVIATAPRYTPDDLLKLEDGGYELENGQLVERDVSVYSNLIGGCIFGLLFVYCQKTRAGWPFPQDSSYQCFPDQPERVRKPDVSFIRRDRLSVTQVMTQGHCSVAPDLVVEVLSPNDLAYEVDARVQVWLHAGVNLVWVVNPEQRTVVVYRAGATGTTLRESDMIRGEQVLPDFECRVADFFALPVDLPAA
jgi:Uma2 family endonuclease